MFSGYGIRSNGVQVGLRATAGTGARGIRMQMHRILSRGLLPVLAVFLVALLVMPSLSVVPSSAESTPSVWTDKVDYAPEETVVIQGSGFEAGLELLVRVTRP